MATLDPALPRPSDRYVILTHATHGQKFAEEAERLRNSTSVIRPVAGPWSPGVHFEGLKPSSQEPDTPKIWIPKRQLQLYTETDGSTEPASTIEPACSTESAAFGRRSGRAVLTTESHSIISSAGTAVGGCQTDNADARITQRESKGLQGGPTQCHLMSKPFTNIAAGDDSNDGSKTPSHSVKKEFKVERYKELHVIGSAALQYLELLMKHTDVLIYGAEQSSVSEAMRSAPILLLPADMSKLA